MRRILAALTILGLGVIPPTGLAATKKSIHFTDHLIGALVQTRGSSSTYVYKVSSKSFGQGAGVLVSKATSSSMGISRGVIYFGAGSIRSVTTYRVAAEPNGLVRVTSSGHDTGLTGVFKGAHGTIHATGTQNPKTNIVTLTVAGTLNY